jgi:RNA polymerase sigma-70 factor (ECF subfamily)
MSRIEPYLDRLYRHAFSLCRDEDMAKDMVQQCALKALSARAVPEDEPAYRAGLAGIVLAEMAEADHAA